jgi:hypothetical protein
MEIRKKELDGESKRLTLSVLPPSNISFNYLQLPTFRGRATPDARERIQPPRFLTAQRAIRARIDSTLQIRRRNPRAVA